MSSIISYRKCSQALAAEMAVEQVSLWQSDRREWQEKQPVTAALAEPLQVVAVGNNQLTTATTDGNQLLINPTWSSTLEPPQRRQVQEHLVWHAAAGDYRPRHYRDAHRWHLACDHAINAQLLQLGADIPLDAVLFPIAATWRREKVYAWLAGHPRPEVEQSIDQLSWQLNRMTSARTLKALDTDWQRHNRATVKRFLGTPWLTDTVAMWLLGHR